MLLFSTGIHDMKDLGLEVDPEAVETNIVFFNVNHHKVSASALVKRMLQVTDSEPVETRVVVMMLTSGTNRIRAVLHHQVTEEDVHKTLKKMRFVLTS